MVYPVPIGMLPVMVEKPVNSDAKNDERFAREAFNSYGIAP
jgi:hypothetical protein